MLAVQADGAVVQSVASLPQLEGCSPSKDGLTPLQAAFRQHHALQCGFCTPGLLVSTALFLSQFKADAGPGSTRPEEPSLSRPSLSGPGLARPGRAEILDHLNGHLCRCSGYANIIAAIESVSA
jgi:aerobic-type carbon monoxide dehydrogenase small subunit (CoxS/CutS family)